MQGMEVVMNRDEQDRNGARYDRFRLSYQLGEFVDEHTTIFGITPSHPNAEKKVQEILDKFLYGDKK